MPFSFLAYHSADLARRRNKRETDKLAGQLLTLEGMKIHYLQMELWSQMVCDRLALEPERQLAE